MPYFDFDVTLSITHTETIEAPSIEEARRIVGMLDDNYDFITDKIDEITTDYEAFDSDHLVIDDVVESDANACDSWVTLTTEEISRYIGAWMKERNA